MGKAGRWIRNILVGKREEKYKNDTSLPVECLTSKARSQQGTSRAKQRWPLGKEANKEASHELSNSLDSIDSIDSNKLEKCKKNEPSFSAESMTTTKSRSQPGTPRMKRRWSLGKAAANKAAFPKVSKSLDSIDTTKLPMQAMAEDEVYQDRANAEFEAQKNCAVAMSVKDAKNAAATKIQAIFRSYLARRALHALKGLVKLQALVRGHLVRKRTSAIMRRMHALIAIQVRARVQRIQIADEAHPSVRGQPSIQRNVTQDNGLRRMYREKMDKNLIETREVLKSKSGYLNYSKSERIEHGFTTYCSGHHSISKREDQYEDPTRASLTFQHPDFIENMSHGYPFLPSYMANTESSRAKVRSQSGPKQCPNRSMKQKSKQMELIDGMSVAENYQLKHSSSHLKHNGHDDHGPWFIKLYQSMRSPNSKFDSTSTTSSHSNQYQYLDAYEPHVTMF
ncbi:protein iq-domain 31 [Fagus crenata]